ncbi:MAG: OmpH family outer membrane protein [Pararhodobacter sp.]|nr:OmpH family outer membrane protein [Pararhodobacter sp.]
MRGVLRAILLAGALLGAPAISVAQEGGGQSGTPIPIAVLDEDRFLRESQLGQQVLAGIRAAEEALEAENEEISDQLAEEERALTAARARLAPEVFRTRADAFAERVEAIRAERRARSEELARFSETEAQRFFEAAFPVLVELMNDEGIVAILKPDALIIALDFVDITSRAIARLDAILQDRPAPLPPAEDAEQ